MPHNILKLRILISIEYITLKQTSDFATVRSVLEKKSTDVSWIFINYNLLCSIIK